MPVDLLLVTQDEELLRRMREQLAPRGLQVEATSGGRNLMEHLLQRPPRLVLLHAGPLEGDNGYLLCSRLKQEPRLQHLPVLLIGAPASNEQHGQLPHHADGYVGEPVDFPALAAWVEEWLRARPAPPPLPTPGPPPAPDVAWPNPIPELPPPQRFRLLGCAVGTLLGGVLAFGLLALLAGGSSRKALEATLGCFLVSTVAALWMGGMAWLMSRLEKKERQAWQTFRQTRGLERKGQGLYGGWEGRALEVRIEKRGTGKNSTRNTLVRLDVRDALPPELTLQHETLGQKVGQLLGQTSDERVGSASFDSKFAVTGLSARAQAVLGETDVQYKLLALASDFFRVSVEQGWLQVEHRLVPDTFEELEALVERVYDTARTLTQAARRRAGT